jgi:hypothetical protein
MPRPLHESRQTTRSASLAIALGGSLLLHAGLGVAIGFEAARAGEQSPDTRFSRFDTVEDPQRPPVQLGDPDARTASLTWIGYQEFEEMWAPESEIDQAQQSPELPGPPSETVTRSELPTESLEEPTIEMAQSPPEPAAIDDPQLAEAAPDDPEPTVDPARLLEMIEALEDLAADLPRFNPIPALVERQRRRTADADSTQVSESDSTDVPVDPRAESGRSPAKPPASGESGLNSDREADAAAVNPVKRDDLDKSLVAEGLSIRTVRPSFSNVTLATARPRNPVVQLDFRRNGVPLPPRIIRSSGHEQVDIQVRIALAQWRAEGEALQQLPEPEDPENPAYFSIKLEILL